MKTRSDYITLKLDIHICEAGLFNENENYFDFNSTQSYNNVQLVANLLCNCNVCKEGRPCPKTIFNTVLRDYTGEIGDQRLSVNLYKEGNVLQFVIL